MKGSGLLDLLEGEISMLEGVQNDWLLHLSLRLSLRLPLRLSLRLETQCLV